MCVCGLVCKSLRVTGTGFVTYIAEPHLYFRQVFPLLLSIQLQSRVCMDMDKTHPDVELQPQLWTFPFYILDICLVLSVQSYKLEDTVYTHALTGGLGVSPRNRRFYTLWSKASSFLLSASAGRSCAEAVDPPWPCYERELRGERWKTEESGYRQFKVFVAEVHSQNQRNAKKENNPHPHPAPSHFPCLTTASVLDLSGCFPF